MPEPTIPIEPKDPNDQIFPDTSTSDIRPSSSPSTGNFTASGGSNEGCVAVNHLKGYVLQHHTHLLRPVLCFSGFCATPNHGIIVDGAYTSMKNLCSSGKWKCICQTKWVNNLKLAVNRRAVISEHFIITPYDVRFPKVAIWAVQMLEDVCNMVFSSLAIGSVLGVVILFLPVTS